MTSQGQGVSVAEGDRLETMDMLRGVALLGVFLMNIEFFVRPLHDYGSGVPAGQGLDHVLGVLIYALVQGKFWVLFSLLFGMGFALMSSRAEAAGRPFVGLYLRRIILLGLFGAAHVLLLWVGDILLSYAITALLLLACVRLRGMPAGLAGMALYFGVGGLWLLMAVGLFFLPESIQEPVRQEMAALAASGAQAQAVYQDGSFVEAVWQRIADYQTITLSNMLFQVPIILGVFLIGRWLVDSGRLQDPAANRPFFRKLAVGGLLLGSLGVGAALALGTTFDPVEQVAQSTLALVLMTLGSLPMALGYLALLVLVSLGPMGRLLRVFVPAGRMALTLYLMQSLIASLIFYGYGLGLAEEFGRTAQVMMVVIVFALQVAFSHWWLARFRQGPLEWLWRAGTYLRWSPLRRTDTAHG